MNTPVATERAAQLAAERAALLAKAEDMQRQIKLQAALESAPALAAREAKVKAFAWPHGARELIAERKRVSEILALRDKVEQKKLDQHGYPASAFHGFLALPVSFHEAFVGSDMQRVTLMDRLHKLYDSQWRSDIVSMHLPSFPEAVKAGTIDMHARGPSLEQRRAEWAKGMQHYYAMAPLCLAEHRDSLLLMQALCAELRPETRELVTRCTHFEQLDVSMLMQSVVDFEFTLQ